MKTISNLSFEGFSTNYDFRLARNKKEDLDDFLRFFKNEFGLGPFGCEMSVINRSTPDTPIDHPSLFNRPGEKILYPFDSNLQKMKFAFDR